MTTSQAAFTPTARLQNHTYAIMPIGQNTYRVLIYSMSNTPITGKDGELHQLLFTPQGDVNYCDDAITIDNIVLSNAGGINKVSQVSLIHVIALETKTESEELALCPSELPYEWYGQMLTEAGSYTATEQYAGMECDSVIHELTLNVYVQTLPASVTLPIIREGEAIDVTIPTAEIQAHIATKTWYAPNAEVAWYIMENSDWAALTTEPVAAGTKQVMLKYAVETDCGNVESEKLDIAVETTDVENIQSQLPISNCQKILRDNQLLIIRDGKTYNVMGQEL